MNHTKVADRANQIQDLKQNYSVIDTSQEIITEQKVNHHILVQVKFPYWIKLSLVIMVYLLQGISFEFIVLSVELKLIQNGVRNEELALLSLIYYPWCFKLIWAPIQDAYFIKYLGRRKTWILGTYLSLTLLWGYFIFFVTEYIENQEVLKISIFGILTSTILAFQDISMDGWIVKLADNDHQLNMFSFWCSFGYPLGGLIAFNANLWFSSAEWCNEYLGTGPIITFQGMTAFVTFGFMIVASIIVFIPEAKDHMELGISDKQIASQSKLLQSDLIQDDIRVSPMNNLRKVMAKLVLFFNNKNLLFLLFVVFTSEIGFTFYDSIVSVIILKHGLDNEKYFLYYLLSIIVEGIAGYIITRTCGKNYMTILKYFLIGFILRTLNSAFQYYSLMAMENNQISQDLGILLYGFQYVIDGVVAAYVGVPVYMFFMHICDIEVEGSYISILTSFDFAGPIWPSTIVYYVSDYVSWQYLALASLGFDVLYLLIFGKKIMSLQDKDLDEWKLQDKVTDS